MYPRERGSKPLHWLPVDKRFQHKRVLHLFVLKVPVNWKPINAVHSVTIGVMCSAYPDFVVIVLNAQYYLTVLKQELNADYILSPQIRKSVNPLLIPKENTLTCSILYVDTLTSSGTNILAVRHWPNP